MKQMGVGLQGWGDWGSARSALGVVDDGGMCDAELPSPMGQMTNDKDEKQVKRAGGWSSRS